MSWAVGNGDNNRDIGYGVPAICDHPKCNVEIDRGMGYRCESTRFSGKEAGCGLYFCMAHGGGSLCKRCDTYKPSYKPKLDAIEWIYWKLKDESWAKWRKDNADTVKLYEQRVAELSAAEIQRLDDYIKEEQL